ncbi:MAG: anthranilate synthase component I, partial [Planctomycetes bacterium]|nr:anthranilate synthase component I [Planctomycetota bacterium]
MYTPDKAAFIELAKQGNIVPVYKILMADAMTPVLACDRLTNNSKYAFLLESVVGGEKIGRYSFLAADPVAVFRSSGKKITLQGFDSLDNVVEEEHDCPLDRLAELMADYQPV